MKHAEIRTIDFDNGTLSESALYCGKVSALAASKAGSGFICAIVGDNSDTIWVYNRLSVTSREFKNRRGRLTSLAVHPNETHVVTGDLRGFITRWYCLTGPPSHTEEKPGSGKNNGGFSTSMHHWHSQAVGSIIFANGGHTLLSGK
jgi:WD40 repeat protein